MKPMLMNTEMVKAILAGRKTQTRRLVKERHLRVLDSPYHKEHSEVPDKVLLEKLCELPYQSGDVLYVRESWCKGSLNGGAEQYFYRADDNDFHCKWRPSIHMPKEAARIFLRVTGVRVERLRDITYEQCIEEGCEGVRCNHDFADYIGCVFTCTDCMGTGWLEPPIIDFVDTWNSTIKKSDIDKYGWDANPWVWVISFESISKEEAMKNEGD